MEAMLDTLSTAGSLLLVVLGFSAIIVIHEAGHFFAARWAGIRVLAFAVGFGPALVSFRKGLGWRRGSSEREYKGVLDDDAKRRVEAVDAAFAGRSAGISPTEYRLNVLPFGGYVKMLGQDDADPGAVSKEPDSYQTCVPWKRMVVISAGVVANIVTAAILFIVVFNPYVGLKSEPPIIGDVEWGQPAATAVATNAAALGVTEPGLKARDRVVSVDGEAPNTFNDFALATAMARPGSKIDIAIERPGVPGILQFRIQPEAGTSGNMLSIGAGPAASGQIKATGGRRGRDEIRRSLTAHGYGEVEPGMQLVAVDGRPAKSLYDLDDAARDSGGKPMTATFARSAQGGKRVDVEVKPKPEMFHAKTSVRVNDKPVPAFVEHVIGVTPLIAVGGLVDEPAKSSGMQAGDVFARLGTVEWPSVAGGTAEIQSNAGKDLRVVVLRRSGTEGWKQVDLGTLKVGSDGRLGFNRVDSAATLAIVASWPGALVPGDAPGSAGKLTPGSEIVAVDGRPVASLHQMREALQQSTRENASGQVVLSVRPARKLGEDQVGSAQEVRLTLSADEIASLSRLKWESPLTSDLFESEKFLWKSATFAGAVPQGLHETRRVMMNTYLTFARLFQGSVKVEHLKGPVGIAHVGVTVADRGFVWLLFFMAMISVNLAVINFLPMPIVDGGQMLFLIYEQVTGRPPSVRFQNAAAVVGLILIGTLFLVVTFHDVSHVIDDVRRWFRS